MATIRERKCDDGRVRYFVAVRLKGFPPQHQTFDRKNDARVWGRLTEIELCKKRDLGIQEPLKHKVGEMIERYERDVLPQKRANYARQQCTQLEWWYAKLGTKVLAHLKAADIAACRDELARSITRRGLVHSAGSVNHYLTTFSFVCGVACREWEWLQDNPAAKVRKLKVPRGRTRFLSNDERERLLSACRRSNHPYLYTIVVVALSTGMRCGEIMSMRWSNTDLELGSVVLDQTKNGEQRSVPLVGHARELLKQLNDSRDPDDELVFAVRRGEYKGKKSVEFRKVWDRVVKEAGLQNFRFHDLRHTAASYLGMNGATLTEISAVLGHKTLSSVKRYTHLTEQHGRAVVERMNNVIFQADDNTAPVGATAHLKNGTQSETTQ